MTDICPVKIVINSFHPSKKFPINFEKIMGKLVFGG